MPRTPLQFKQMKDERKLSILESALPLFAVHGLESVSIDMICQKAKCSHGLAYHYFKNTDQIYKELLSSETYKNLYASLNNINLDSNAFSQLVEKTKQLLSVINGSRENICFLMFILSNNEKNSFSDNITKLISVGQRQGEVTGGDPKDIYQTWSFFYKGIYQTILNEKHPVIKVPSIDNIIQIFEK